MEFWGVEVKPGQSLEVKPEIGKLIHISQASLGEVTDVKEAKYVPLRLKIDDKTLVIGSLSAENRPQVMFDLVFEREFEISHGGKTSVFFLGYSADEPISDDDEFSSDDFDSEDEDVNVTANAGNGILRPTKADVKAIKAGIANKAGAKKDELSDDDDEDDSEPDSEDEMALDGQPLEDSDDSEDDEDDSDDEEELPKEQPSKKRPAEAKQKTPASKKAKSATPDKSGKKGQNATPAPSKSAGKDNSKDKTPKSSSQETCKSCSKTFTSANALMAHSKAKHGGK